MKYIKDYPKEELKKPTLESVIEDALSRKIKDLAEDLKYSLFDTDIFTDKIAEMLGQLFVCGSREDDDDDESRIDALYISFNYGDIDLESGWKIGEEELSEELAGNTMHEGDNKQIAQFLRRVADRVEAGK